MTEAAPKFIVDQNVGKLARWLRLMGFDTAFFEAGADSLMVARALAEGRIILTRDTEIAKRRLARTGRLRVILIETEDPPRQIKQVVRTLDLDSYILPFTRCLEDNTLLAPVPREQVQGLVSPYVYQTQGRFMRCPLCLRVYWQGTHWTAMTHLLAEMGGPGARGEMPGADK